MLEKPRFKPHLRVKVVPGEGAFVLSESRQVLLRGRLYERVVPHVDGRPAAAVCAALGGEVRPAEVFFVLGQLEQRGYLCDAEPSLPPGEAALWSAQQVDPAEAARRLGQTSVSVRAFGVEDQGLRAALASVRLPVAEGGALGVVAVDGYLRGELGAVNADALRTGRPWLLVRPVGRELWLGPLFRPGLTGCWECLAQRLRANRPVEVYLDGHGGQGTAAAGPPCSPATLGVAWGLAANAAATWAARGELPELEGKIQTFDVISYQARAHVLVRLPYCPACAAPRPADGAPRPAVLQRRPKGFTADGGHRATTPEATLERYERHVSPITGAVSMLQRVGPQSDGAMHVYLAGSNVARRAHNLDHLRKDLRSNTSGKGTTEAQARASGLCEGLERYSGVFRGDEPRRRARLADLGEEGIHPNDCMRFSERQYDGRDAWNARPSPYSFVPRRFDPAAVMDWTPVWSLTHDAPRYLPTAFCYFNYPLGGEEPACVACSNGNAAGNTLEEAVLQGFFELVERDSVALWWYNRVRRPGVDLDSFAEPYLGRLREFLGRRRRNLWVLDLTSDLGVPVFAALSRRVGEPEEHIVLGFGAHLDARVALLRAVTELNQMLASLLLEGRDGLSEAVTDADTVAWLRTATTAGHPYLLAGEGPARAAGDYSRGWSDDLAEDVRLCQRRVEAQGMQMLVLDQTRPEIGLPVAKVIVPGLRHFWARFAPGRLYDVPVRLGWLDRPLAEEALNPVPMFL
jgi:ribosomal protein S12 methylthiotransferase accessory factor